MIELGHDHQQMLDDAAALNESQFLAYQNSEHGKADLHAFNAKMGIDEDTCEYTSKFG